MADAPPSTRQIAEAVLLDKDRRRNLLAYARSRFGIRPEDGEDLLQDTMLDLLNYRSYVRKPEGFVFSVFRARCARFVAAGMGNRQKSSLDTKVDDAFSTLDRMYRRLALREGLGMISQSCRQILRTYYLEGRSLREAASSLSLAYSSIAKTISRCLRRLRECVT